jgi:MarR family transcriptional regulator, organic hydroperoxide resistance regulator
VTERETFAELVHLLFEVSARIGHQGKEVAAKHGLSAPAANALWQAGVGEGAPSMRELAALMRTDPARVTALADQLEERGLLERRTDPANRRVKQLVLTPEGARVRQSVMDEVLHGSPLGALTAAERTLIADLFNRALSASSRPRAPHGPPAKS